MAPQSVHPVLSPFGIYNSTHEGNHCAKLSLSSLPPGTRQLQDPYLRMICAVLLRMGSRQHVVAWPSLLDTQ